MRKQKRQMCVRRMLLFFLACVLICAAPPSVAQAAIMQTAKNSTVQDQTAPGGNLNHDHDAEPPGHQGHLSSLS